jgi:hypothetical protein
MAYRAKRIIRRSSLYPTCKSLSVTGSKSKVGFIDAQLSSSQKRKSLPCLEGARYDGSSGLKFLLQKCCANDVFCSFVLLAYSLKLKS